MKQKKTIIVISSAIFLAGVIYLLTRNKKDNKTDIGQAESNIENKTDNTNTDKPETKKSPPALAKGAPAVTVDNAGANIYSLGAKNRGVLGRVIRKTTKANEKVGSFLEYRTNGGSIYVLFSDTLGRKSLALKALTNYKNFY